LNFDITENNDEIAALDIRGELLALPVEVSRRELV